MLTPKEQEQILKQAKAFARLHIAMKRRLERSEVSPRHAKERLEQAEEELRDTLKEVG